MLKNASVLGKLFKIITKIQLKLIQSLHTIVLKIHISNSLKRSITENF